MTAELGRSSQGETFSPIVASTRTFHVGLRPHAFDCAQLTVVRAGSAILFGEFGHRYLNLGDVALIPPHTLFGMEPEPWVTMTTLYVDRDFLTDQIFWQYAAWFADRLDMQQFLDAHPVDPARVIRLGEQRVGVLMPWLDELAIACSGGLAPERFYRVQSLLFAVFDVVIPTLDTETKGHGGRRSVLPTLPRHRQFAPLREAARTAAALLRDGFAEEWTLDRLAAAVHLSRSQTGRMFRQAFGKTPIAYLTMLRTERMAELLRTTTTPISEIAREVGWDDPAYASRLFRRALGYTPRAYRAMSRQNQVQN